jgi:hypothetical protein
MSYLIALKLLINVNTITEKKPFFATLKLTTMLYKRILPFFIALLSLPVLLNAQITTSSLTGTVRSVEGEDLQGATITATHQPTGTRYTTVSRTGGTFNIPSMRSGGPYIVQVTFVGYAADTHDNINLQLGEPFILNSELQKSSAALQGVVLQQPVEVQY